MARPAVLSLFEELWAFMRVRKKWWLGPIVVVLVLFELHHFAFCSVFFAIGAALIWLLPETKGTEL